MNLARHGVVRVSLVFADTPKIERSQVVSRLAPVEFAILEQCALVEKQEAICDGGGFGKIMRGKKHGRALYGQRADERPEIRCGGCIEAAGWLVE
jgi:hypothetical protein